MATMRMQKKDTEEAAPEKSGQGRVKRERYLLQVDRQTKYSYPSMELAEKAGRAIKKSHPVVKVSIYDSEESTNTPVE